MAWLECKHTVRDASRTVKLRKVLTTVGSAPGNDVVLDDPAIAQSHASLMRQGKDWTVAVNDRAAIVHVNGRRTRRAPVEPGDDILVGAWKLTFHEGEPTHDDAAEIDPVPMLEQLVQLSADMMAATTPEKLFSTLLTGLVRLTRAQKGFVILFQDGERRLAASHNVGTGSVDLSTISDSIVDRVVETQTALIVSDALHDQRFGKAKSVVDLKLSSVLCVPLRHQGDLLGVIYLGNDAVQDLFTRDDLTLLEVYAHQASLVVYHALLLNQLRVDNEALRKQLGEDGDGGMVGESPPMQKVSRTIRKVAPTDLSVLVLGETGTGKELVAREVHQRSGRRDGPFIAINCGAIPENLLESELFGHRKGAFTGAEADKIGKIEAADGGTLFLDEIGEMPMNLQVKLLRVLQERIIERVGDVQGRPIDIRVVAATNRDPKALIADGKFREDLFYRLHEIAIHLPPLRERGEDIVLLSQLFLRRYKERYGGKARGFTNQALASLKSAKWPGNVRQLENHVKKAVIMSERALLNPTDLGLDAEPVVEVVPLSEAQERFKIDYIREILERNHGNKAQTARDLGVDARTIFRYVDKIEGEA